MILKRYILATIILGWAGTAFSAEIQSHVLSHPSGPAVEITIDGELSDGDGEELERQLRYWFSKKMPVERISLRSNGGLLSEGIKIGSLVRKYLIETEAPIRIREQIICRPQDYVDHQGKKMYARSGPCMCASACAIAWLGGIRRVGIVGVHRSFIPLGEARLDYDEYSKILDVSHLQIKDYLEEVRVPNSIIEKVLATASREIAYIAAGSDGLLPIEDRVFQEYILSICQNPLTPLENEEWINLSVKRYLQESLSHSDVAKLLFLDGKARNHGNCYIEAMVEARKQAQFE